MEYPSSALLEEYERGVIVVMLTNSRGKKSGRATYSSNIPKKWVNFKLVSHGSLLVDYSFYISTIICIPQHFFRVF